MKEVKPLDCCKCKTKPLIVKSENEPWGFYHHCVGTLKDIVHSEGYESKEKAIQAWNLYVIEQQRKEREDKKNMEKTGRPAQAEPEYFGRLRYEYHEVKDRYNELHKMLVRYDAGTLKFNLNCPVELLREQKRTMGRYLNILEIRAEIEGIDLE